MRKYTWAIIAGVCVLVLIVVGAIFLLWLLKPTTHPSEVSEGHIVLRPEHWWKMEMTEQQRTSLVSLWGNDITAAQLLQELWPEVLQEMPQEARVCCEERQIRWPTEAYGDWRNEMLHNLRASPGDRGPVVCSVYIGTHENEQFTFEVAGDRGFAEDRTYRVSIYTDISGG